jgi:hypothetical protein
LVLIADCILFTHEFAKAAAKEATDRQRVAAEEVGAKQAELEAARAEAKKLKERLDASTSYIDSMKNKSGSAAVATAHLVQLAVAPAVSENVAELQGSLKVLHSLSLSFISHSSSPQRDCSSSLLCCRASTKC